MKPSIFDRFIPLADRPRLKRRAVSAYHRATPTIYWVALLSFFGLIMAALIVGSAKSEPLQAPEIDQETRTASEPQDVVIAPENAESGQPSEPTAQPAPIVGSKGVIATVGAFSDVECGSDWCDLHEPKDDQIAINFRKYGRRSKVYIPAFNKTYRVVGNTYSENGNHFDAEIWFGPDRAAALKFGTKDLRLTFID